MKALLREPLVHFIAIAVLFFAAYGRLNPLPAEQEVITVSEGRAAQLRNAFISRWQRAPLANEMLVAMEGYALNQMYLREARALGLDQNDPVIERRLRQKMSYLLEDLVADLSPSDQQLQQFYQEHGDRYRESAQVAFEQVYLAVDRSAAELAQLQFEQQRRIEQGLAPTGDRSLLPSQLAGSVLTLERQLGPEFVQGLQALPLARWVGPLRSALGLHYVRIVSRSESRLPPLEQVQARVRADWHYQEVQRYKDGFEQQLLNRYRVAIETPLAEEAEGASEIARTARMAELAGIVR